MIKDASNMESVTLTVITKDGTTYSKRDTTSNPFGENHKVVAFWDESGLMMIPMENVESVTLHFDS